jgi:outer membrane protein OmpA-like peptidoglycan-associated protein
MRLREAALLSACVWLAGPGIALAQSVDRGNEVTVNPVMGGSSSVLLYPGDQYMRVIHPALEPGETINDMGPIQLHMPARHRVARKAPTQTAAAAPSEQTPPAASKPKEVAKQAPKAAKPQSKAVAAAAPMAPPALNSGFGDPGAQGAVGLSLGLAPAQPAASPTRLARLSPPPVNVTTPPGAGAETPGLSKRSVILFAPQAADPAESALGAIKFLAGDLNAAMTSASSRIQIQAYGGNRGDKGSDARRLSLKRALAVRQVLIDDGVPAERIDVRAMGGVDDTGPADRVDVFVKA